MARCDFVVNRAGVVGEAATYTKLRQHTKSVYLVYAGKEASSAWVRRAGRLTTP